MNRSLRAVPRPVRGFHALFWTQFLGAFNDNLFRSALAVLVTFRLAGIAPDDARTMVLAAAGVFILPFFLFSAAAGQLADKLEKTRLVRIVKLAEIGIVAVAVPGFLLPSLPLLFGVLFLLGCHSAFFGPLKYALIPALVAPDGLTRGNALVEAGTFVAILLGTIGGAVVMGIQPDGAAWSVAACGAVAVAGYLASRRIARVAPAEPGLAIRANPFTQTARVLGEARADGDVWWAVIAISWFWLYGTVFVQLAPSFVKTTLGGGETLVAFANGAYTVGVGLGSLLAAWLSARRVEPGLVPLGAAVLVLAPAFLLLGGSERTVAFATLALVGAGGGLFTVPLYALVQERARPGSLSRAIAANNIVNAVFMVAASGWGMVLVGAGFTDAGVWTATGGATLFAAGYVFRRRPEYLKRAGLFFRCRGRVTVTDRELQPGHGPLLVIADPRTRPELDALLFSLRRWPATVLSPDAGLLRRATGASSYAADDVRAWKAIVGAGGGVALSLGKGGHGRALAAAHAAGIPVIEARIAERGGGHDVVYRVLRAGAAAR